MSVNLDSLFFADAGLHEKDSTNENTGLSIQYSTCTAYIMVQHATTDTRPT
jgi:hypothetical protein